MNLLLVEAEEVDAEGRVCLADRRAEHLLRVLRVDTGSELRAGVIGGAVGRGRVRALGARTVEIELDLEEERPLPRRTTDVVLALPRPAVLHRVLQAVATMGVGRLDLVRSWRVEKSYFASPALRPEAVRRHLILGAEQGQTTRLPEVRVHRLFAPFMTELETVATTPMRLVAHPGARRVIEEAFVPVAGGQVQIAIGPEGGWIDREVESFSALGFEPVRLGPWVLRVETALAATLAQVELLRRKTGAVE